MNNLLSTGQLAQLLGVSLSTIYRWLKSSKIDEPNRTIGGHRRFNQSKFIEKNTKTVIYSRVSSYGQKDDLKRQEIALKDFAKSNNYHNIISITDIGSGLNFRKKGFTKLLKMIVNREINSIIIQEKNRLSRFGIDIIKSFSQEFGTKIVITNNPNQTYESKLMSDLMALLTSFTGSIHGRRSHKNSRISV